MRNTFGDPLVPGRSWPAPWQPYQPIVASDASLPLSMTRQRAFVMACHEKDPLPCHAERQRSIWFHQAGGVAHLGFFAALRMTCPGHFLIACRKKGPLPCHAERERSIWSHQAGGVAHLGFFAALRMTCPGHFLIACRKKGPLACHAERERSIWSHQAGGVAHLGFFAALRMTCPGHFLIACYWLSCCFLRKSSRAFSSEIISATSSAMVRPEPKPSLPLPLSRTSRGRPLASKLPMMPRSSSISIRRAARE